MSKSFALAAFNAAVVATNAAHAAKRGVVAAASFTKDNAVAGTTATKEAGVAFWAGMKYAHQYNKDNGVTAERLTAEDVGIAPEVEKVVAEEVIDVVAKPRATTKRAAK